jgi:hypothetical protein
MAGELGPIGFVMSREELNVFQVESPESVRLLTQEEVSATVARLAVRRALTGFRVTDEERSVSEPLTDDDTDDIDTNAEGVLDAEEAKEFLKAFVEYRKQIS